MKILMIDDCKSIDYVFFIMQEYYYNKKDLQIIKKNKNNITIARTYDKGKDLLIKEKWDYLLLDNYLEYNGKDGKEGIDLLYWLKNNPEYLPLKAIFPITNSSYKKEEMIKIINKGGYYENLV